MVSEVSARLNFWGWRVGRRDENEDQEPEKNLREMLWVSFWREEKNADLREGVRGRSNGSGGFGNGSSVSSDSVLGGEVRYGRDAGDKSRGLVFFFFLVS
jgi:hypothetical protein